MVHIPVGLYTATQGNDIHFNQLCKEDGSQYSRVCWKTRPRKKVWKKKACHEEIPRQLK